MRGQRAHMDRYGRYARIVGLVVRGRWEEIPALWQPDDATGDNSFDAFVARQHLAHYLLRRIDTEGKAGLFPEPVVGGLRRVVEQRRRRSDRYPAALGEVASAFAAARVDCLMLKGLPFAARYYGDPRLRAIHDIDLLVRRADANRALRILLDLGYRPKRRRVRAGSDGPRIRRHRLRTEHALGLQRDDIEVDLHWRLRTAPAYRLAEEAVWTGTQEIATAGIPCRAPSDEFALVLLLLSIAHDIGRSACRLKHLLDVHQLLRLAEATTDWDRFLERRREENDLRICVNVLGIVLDLLGGREDLPRLAAALSKHAALRVPPAGPESILLLFRAGRRMANALWFARVYPGAGTRDLLWLLDRFLSHPGRILLIPWKVLRACYWTARYLLGPARAPA